MRLLPQIRLAHALPFHSINAICYTGMVAAQRYGMLDLGLDQRPLLNVVQFLGCVVLLPIATTSLLEVSPPPCRTVRGKPARPAVLAIAPSTLLATVAVDSPLPCLLVPPPSRRANAGGASSLRIRPWRGARCSRTGQRYWRCRIPSGRCGAPSAASAEVWPLGRRCSALPPARLRAGEAALK